MTSASSSFLDELLGRLADEMGAERFRETVRVVGMLEEIQEMAQVVVGQRVQGAPERGDHGNG